MSRYLEIESFLGKTFVKIKEVGDHLLFQTVNEEFVMYHESDCCEQVYIESINGELDWLIGSPIVVAEKTTNRDNPKSQGEDSWTWTFYRLATNKGTVVIRWYGSSNGYYSESVSVVKTK
jgi:hypothetical protein